MSCDRLAGKVAGYELEVRSSNPNHSQKHCEVHPLPRSLYRIHTLRIFNDVSSTTEVTHRRIFWEDDYEWWVGKDLRKGRHDLFNDQYLPGRAEENHKKILLEYPIA